MRVANLGGLGRALGAVVAIAAVASAQSPAPAVSGGSADPGGRSATRVSRVLCAVSLDGTGEAWISTRGELQLQGWAAAGGAPLPLGAGAWPRFAPDGRFVFTTGEDDGHRVLGTHDWVLEPGSSTPRSARPDEALPAWTAPPTRAAATGGATRLCIDPGHGGADPGASGNGLLEKDVNLDVALRFADLLDADSADGSGGGAWEVLLTREADVSVSLLQRVTLANAFGADSFCSIHSNSFSDPSAHGTETYSFAEGTTAAALRDRVHARMLDAWGLTDRGTKTAGFYVLVNTSMPAELAEMGFITNAGDAAFLGSPAQRQAMALAHLFAVQEHHGYGVHEPGGGGGTLKGILHHAGLGTGAPIAGGTVALADGRFTLSSASGYYEFALPAGTWAFAATAPGYAAAASGETVTSGDVWQSLGLWPASLPSLVASAVAADADLDLSGGDPFSAAWLCAALEPNVPPPTLGPKGQLWPDAGALFVFPAGTLGAGGTLHLDLGLPSAPGFSVHVQGYVPVGGAGRLTNGAAIALP